MKYNFSNAMYTAVNKAYQMAHAHSTNEITTEMLLYAVITDESVARMLGECQPQPRLAASFLKAHIDCIHYEHEMIRDGFFYTHDLEDILQQALSLSRMSNSEVITMERFIMGIFCVPEGSYARKWLIDHLQTPLDIEVTRLGLLFREVVPGQTDEAEQDLSPEPAVQVISETGIPYCHAVSRMGGQDWRLIGREKEMDSIMGVLCRMQRPNPILVGEHGVGKSAIISGLGMHLRSGLCPARLRGKRIVQLNISEVLAGSAFRGDLESRLTSAMQGIVDDGNTILFIDKIHELIGAGRLMESTVDATSLIFPYLENRRVQLIGATTFSEYRKAVNKCPTLEMLFQRVDIDEPSVKEAGEIIQGLAPSLERFHRVHYTEASLTLSASLATRFSLFGRLPGSAFCLLDEAGVQAGKERNAEKTVTSNHVKAVFSRLSGIDITGNDLDDIRQLGARLKERVFGQDAAVDLVSDAICASKVGLNSCEKPIASLLFVGTTGVGKTFLARELARLLGLPLHRLDMSEYASDMSVSRLIGSSAGYIGYEDGGVLTNLVRETPHCVLLLDEIEKAHEKIYNLLLQVMDAGSLTDGQGVKTDFRNVILIMTSNAGARDAARVTVGFTPGVRGARSMEAGIRETFPPEFINRLTAQVVFNSVDEQMAARIMEERISELERALTSKRIRLEFTQEAREAILQAGYSPLYGARELERVINQEVRPLVVREILYGGLEKGGQVTIHYEDEHFTCSSAAVDQPSSAQEKGGSMIKRFFSK